MTTRTAKKRATAKDVLLSPAGQEICRAMRRETWFVLMTSSSDPTMRRLGAGIFVAAAMNELVPERATWDDKPACPHCRQSSGRGHKCSRKQASDYFAAHSSFTSGRP